VSVARDTAYNLAAAVAPAAFLLAVTPFYLDTIGPDRFGVLALCWTIVSALRFASLGMGPALTYRLAVTDDEAEGARSAIVWTALMIALAASFVGAILVVGIGELYFRLFFRAASALEREVMRALPFLGALLPLAILIGVLNGALQGSRRFGALSVIGIINSALLAVTPLAVAYLISVSLKALILATAAASAVVVLCELAICIRVVPLGKPRRFRRSEVKALIGYGSWMSATAFIAPLVLLLDRFLIGALRGPAAVAVYVLPYNVVQQLILIPASLTSAILPRLASIRDEEEVQKLQSSSLLWLNGLLTPLSVAAIALSAPFFHLWIGPTLGKIASPVAAILLVGAWAHGIAHIPSTFVIGRSRPDILTKQLLACLPLYVVILCLATLHFGVIGAATAWTIRAAFDPVLFFYTRPRRSDMLRIAASAVLVLCAMVTALALTWTGALYWGVMALLIAAACYQNRTVLISSVGEFRKLAFRTT
jgi:O-antigen/teichoic acid export membrane protein